ncbi:MAG TPA: hypothetical protein VN285_10490 [Candidatus Deferrimicrobium sp.]|nr:hypothetical protein [Candidatus Deferrimicrobium sp.]
MSLNCSTSKLCIYALGMALVFAVTLTSASAEASPELEVVVGDTIVLPGTHSIPVYMKNYSDSVAAFNIWLQLSRPDIMEFEITFDTVGTLISGWEYVFVNSLGGLGYDLNIVALANMLDPPVITPGIGHPQTGELPLIKLILNVYDIPDTMTDRTVDIFINEEFAGRFCFSTPQGQCIGITDGSVDTTKITIHEGSLTVVRCGDVDGLGGDPNVADLTYLVSYLFGGGAPPTFPAMADVDGVPDINIADITWFVSYLFGGGPALSCP